jgi:hypothetical protein
MCPWGTAPDLTRATIFTLGIFGYSAIQVRELFVTEPVAYAQYLAAIRMLFIPKGARKRRQRYDTHGRVVIVRGWSAPVLPKPYHSQNGCYTNRHESCSPEWEREFDEWLLKHGLKPVYDFRNHDPQEKKWSAS